VITGIHVSNFKAFRDQRFPLAPLTLLAGLNGSGKSSLLQALLVIRQSFDSGLLNRGNLALNGDLLHLGRFQDALFEAADIERISIAIESDLQQTYSWTWRFQSKHDRIGLSENGELAVDPSLSLFNEGFRFLSAERIGPRNHYAVPDTDNVASKLGVQGEWTPHYLTRHGERPIPNEVCAHSNARSLQLSHQVEAWMSELSPGLQIHFDRDPDLDLVRLSYSFIARSETSGKYRPTNVGFGVSYTLPVITAVLAARAGDLLLLESPEAHLHPRGQAMLGELLSRAASAGVQIVVESHSDHIMNGIRIAIHQNTLKPDAVSFLYFRWNPENQTGATEVRRIQVDPDGRIDAWPEGFFDELDRSLDVLLTPKPR
jgi:predicted ATPase